MQIPAGKENHTGEQPAKWGVESVTKHSREGAQGKSYRKICSSSASVGVPPVFPPGSGLLLNSPDSKCKGPGVEVSLICLRKLGGGGRSCRTL